MTTTPDPEIPAKVLEERARVGELVLDRLKEVTLEVSPFPLEPEFMHVKSEVFQHDDRWLMRARAYTVVETVPITDSMEETRAALLVYFNPFVEGGTTVRKIPLDDLRDIYDLAAEKWSDEGALVEEPVDETNDID